MIKTKKAKKEKRVNPFAFKDYESTSEVSFIGSLFDCSPTLFDSEKPSTDNNTTCTVISLFDTEKTTNVFPAVADLNIKKSSNFKITDEKLGVGSVKQKFQWNIDAIETMKKCLSENREATQEEKEILSKYVGWGGCADCFEKDTSENEKLLSLLTTDEYTQAKSSVLTAFYTSPVIIKNIYKYLANCNFTRGNILEPGCGIGNFFGMLPEAMSNSNLYGVEIDSITGNIAQLLYPDAHISIKAYEKTEYDDNYFDVVVGNVPFSDIGIADHRYDRLNLSTHDYFFAKSIDKVRPGGVVILLTSRYTMDKKKSKFREYISQRCELIGAVRLPNNAFKANSGTDVVSDILFLKKRENMCNDPVSWTKTLHYEDEIFVNEYFSENLEMVLGTLDKKSTRYGKDTLTVVPLQDKTLDELLEKAISRLPVTDLSIHVEQSKKDDDDVIPAIEKIRNYSYGLYEDKIYFRKNSIMERVHLMPVAESQMKSLINIKDTLYELLDKQLETSNDDELTELQQDLSFKYNLYVKTYGRLGDRKTTKLFREDISLPLLKSLEVYDKKGVFKCKADIFTKRTCNPTINITHCDNAVDALGVSLSQKGKVSLPYIKSLTGLTEDQIKDDLLGRIFLDPEQCDADGNYVYVTADEYLSGNIRKKLNVVEPMAEKDNRFEDNVVALKKAMPAPLEATDIYVKLGATWVPTDIYNQFMYHLLSIPQWQRDTEINRKYSEKDIVGVSYSSITCTYNISNKSECKENVKIYEVYGTSRMNALHIIENTLNQRIVKIYDYKEVDGKKRAVLNEEETHSAQQKQEMIKDRFSEWVFDDADRRQMLVDLYNEKFNSIKPRTYDGSHLTFSGMNKNIVFHKHQKDAVARTLYGGNTLLAHEMGLGKTFEMIAAIMEGKKLGKLTKALIVVPNHLTKQFGNEFLTLYPNANIIVATEQDFSKTKRQEFVTKIATCNVDAIIMGHSQLVKIPISDQRLKKCINDQLIDLDIALSESEERYTIKSIETARKSLETKLEKIKERVKHGADTIINFEQLGIDKLCIDEAHYFKNLQIATKMSNVAGISTTAADKSSDLLYKCQYLDEITDYSGTIFATGTPVSNSMVEIYTMMKYLQADVLEDYGLSFFDAWASNFGETVLSFELAPEGTGYRMKERFAKFHNVPELLNLFKLCADIKLSEEVDLDLPKLNTETIACEPTKTQKSYVEQLSERATAIHNRMVSPEQDNMLKITSDGRKLGLDQRLICEDFEDEEGTKVNACVNKVFDIWQRTKNELLTQVIFCDISTPSKCFNIYDDVKNKLVNLGIPADEIQFIHDYPKTEQKNALFQQVREGSVKILIGSTVKLGVGTNIQDKLVASHDLDIPWRPSDLQQRLGRMVRQGNKNDEVFLYRYVTKGTFDSYLYQILEQKQRFIGQILTTKNPARSCDDVDEATLDFATVKALCAGNPEVKEKMELDIEVKKLEAMLSSFKYSKYSLEDNIKKLYPENIAKLNRWITAISRDIENVNNNSNHNEADSEESTFEIEFAGVHYTKRADAALAFDEVIHATKVKADFDDNCIGYYSGFEMNLKFNSFTREHSLRLKGNFNYYIELSDSLLGNITKIENVVKKLPERLDRYKQQLEETERQLALAQKELDVTFGKFPHEDELTQKKARLAELNLKLNMSAKIEAKSA